jgi:hypothetical protein
MGKTWLPLRAMGAAAMLAGIAAGACGDSAESESGDGGQAQGAAGAGAGGAGMGGIAGGSGGAGGGEGGAGGEVDKAQNCTDTFGDSLTDSYARLDGTVLAVVGPTDTQCPLFNDDHLVIEVMMNGEAYRMVVNVDGIGYAEHEAPLLGGAFSEGWHTDVDLEYADDLGVHSDEFESHSMAELVDLVTDHIELDAPISVYAVSSGGEFASSAHLVHHNNSQPDGAIAIDPTAATSRYLLFRFDNQQF